MADQQNANQCPMCGNAMQMIARTNTCGHQFCSECLQRSFQTNDRCPVCQCVYTGIVSGSSYCECTWTRVVNGRQRTYRKVVRNGVEIVTAHENGRLVYKSVNGVPQPIAN